MATKSNAKSRVKARSTTESINSLLESEEKRNFEKRNNEYLSYVEAKSPKGSWVKPLFHAFLVGGSICCFGQLIGDIFKSFDPIMNFKTVSAWINIIIISLTTI
ncbi:MAG: SpoVA/SpoVAEb family sporulation membrane protein, partial [Clostridia bacterium]|nr:SpoVA/SpoVAEb family sporulation membrane protein [Clostridia bacterium]